MSASPRRRQSGQLMPIAAVAFMLIAGLAGLSIDASRDYLVKRQAQNAVDFAVLAAAKQLSQSTSLGSPIAPNSTTVRAAHDFAANNGFDTINSSACDTSSPTSFTTTWFDVGGLSCSATSGFTNKVTINSPPVGFAGNPVPEACTGLGQYACIQVVITAGVQQLFTSILGIPTVYVTVAATAQVTLPASTYSTPPPNALILYQPQSACVPAAQQCFNEALPVSRTAMSCLPTSNCPTFWAVHGSQLFLAGYDGSYVIPAQHLTAVISNGDMVIQDRTTFCDPYNNAVCVKNAVVGLAGFAVPSGSKVYCQKYGAAAANATPCTTAGQSTLNELDAQQTAFINPSYWSPTIDTTGLQSCGGLVLNGDPVTGPCANAVEPYVIEPGIYSYIVINHGTYEFETGLFDITGLAPVNTATGAGYAANGIDHSRETAGTDFDLCTGGQPNSCPTLTAGVWIGHGGGSFGALVKPPSGSCVAGAGGTSTSGGGDPTIVSGSGVTFRLEATSGGFVSTGEVKGMLLSSPGVGSLPSVSGAPLLVDMENNSFIHLDAVGSDSNGVSGIIYQTQSATAGGVELNPSMTTGGGNAALTGQVLAYSFTTFGGPGVFSFQSGYGSGSVPGVTTSGKNEAAIISKVTLTAGAPGFSVLTVYYADEWALDAYDLYVKVNSGSPVFFSQGIWTTTPAPGDPLPPPNNNPGDAFPAYPSGFPAGYTVVSPTDYIYSIPGSGGATIEVKGSWTWGHQQDIAGANSANYNAQALYTFPTPNGNYVSITIFLTDGDHCGDYALATYTFKNVGLPVGGTQSGGTVSLVQ